MTDRPLILLANDDGIDAPGLRALAAALDGLGEIVVVAPIAEQSAVGHSITVRDPVRAHRWPAEAFPAASLAFAVTGTPADCVKLAIHRLVPRRPALVVSGINNGPNTAVNVIYSGTVSAATEAAILGIDSIAVSQDAWGQTDFAESGRWARRVAEQVLARGLPPGVLLNVNIPYDPDGGIQGVRVTRQARARWEEVFDERLDPQKQPYYWLTGTFTPLDDRPDTDLAAIADGYVSVTPIHYDLTALDHLADIGRWSWGDAATDGDADRPGGAS